MGRRKLIQGLKPGISKRIAQAHRRSLSKLRKASKTTVVRSGAHVALRPLRKILRERIINLDSHHSMSRGRAFSIYCISNKMAKVRSCDCSIELLRDVLTAFFRYYRRKRQEVPARIYRLASTLTARRNSRERVHHCRQHKCVKSTMDTLEHPRVSDGAPPHFHK